MNSNNGVKVSSEPPVEYTAWDLNRALQHLVEVLERSIITDWFILGSVARDIKDRQIDIQPNSEGVMVAVDHRAMSIQVRKMLKEIAQGVLYTSNMDDFVMDENKVTWNYLGVPVTIRVVHNKYPFFMMPATEFFRYDIYKIPNPFDKYWQQRGLIR